MAMEKMTTTTMMISSRSPENLRIESISNDPLTTSSTDCPTWKLYENPFYTNTPQNQNQIKHHKKQQHHYYSQENKSDQPKQIHRLHLPISARKIAASFWDLTFIRALMESELDKAGAKITELKAELEQERKARKKAESMNKKLARQLWEKKKGREALEQLCEKLAKQVSSDKAEINRMHREMEEERKMLRIAEVLREERVQMKLTEAKLLWEDKLSEVEAIRCTTTKQQQVLQIHEHYSSSNSQPEANTQEKDHILNASNKTSAVSGEEIRSCVLVEKPTSSNNIIITTADTINIASNPSAGVSQRRASAEPENPHIKRGIKGFVEFPKVLRAISSKSRHLGTKLECQKSQLRIMLKYKNPIPIRSNTLISS